MPAEIKFREARAEFFAGAVRITFSTATEFNSVGHRVWRETNGRREIVNEQIIAGSLFAVSNGALPAGSEYVAYDRSPSRDAFYWIETLDINGQSQWNGPVFPFEVFASGAERAESATIADRAVSSDARSQYDSVPFTRNATSAAAKRVDRRDDQFFSSDPNALKIEVTTRGFHHVPFSDIVDKGFNPDMAGNWRLFNNGVEQPMIVNEDRSIEFFGETIETVQTSSNIYWLVTDVGDGERIDRTVADYNQTAVVGRTRVTAERRDRSIRVSSVLNGGIENWFTAVVNATPVNQTLTLSEIAVESGETATVSLELQGLTAYPHIVAIKLNGVQIGTANYQSYMRHEFSTQVPLSMLNEGVNTVTLSSSGGTYDIGVAEAVRINYPRRHKALNDRLEFVVPAGNQPTKITGFSGPDVRVFDITNPADVVEVAPASVPEQDSTYSVSLEPAASARLMLAVGAETPLVSPASVQRNRASNLRDSQNAANFVVIAPFDLRKHLHNLAYIRSINGINTMIVDVEDIYDEFNDGIPSAEAIRSFLRHAKTNWTVGPSFAMFVGDASVDPRNFSGLGGPSANRIPTMFTDTWNMETVSDEMMGDFDGDSVAEIALGRLPAKNEIELEAMLDKIIVTEPLSIGDFANRGVHFISDSPIGYDFAAGSRNMATEVPALIQPHFLDAQNLEINALRADIIRRINSGPAIVNYFGHASVGIWASSQMFRASDAPSLYNPKKPAFFGMINCLNGDFVETTVNSLAEAVLKQPRGGANAVWASTGWNGAFDQEFYAKKFYQFVFQGMPAGEAARQSKRLFPIQDLRRTYVFFGDPTQPLVTYQ